jgi:hypothetical protein
MRYLAASCAIFALLAAWAWMKSAFLSKGKTGTFFPDDWMNKISTEPTTWNAIAAVLAAAAAVCQAIIYLFVYPAR